MPQKKAIFPEKKLAFKKRHIRRKLQEKTLFWKKTNLIPDFIAPTDLVKVYCPINQRKINSKWKLISTDLLQVLKMT